MTDARTLSLDELVERIAGLPAALGRPAVVGVSGYGGAGKSTLDVLVATR